MNPLWEQAARAYYVSEALGVRQKAHLQLFHDIHDKQFNFRTGNWPSSIPVMVFLKRNLTRLIKSFPISSKIAQAKNLTIIWIKVYQR